MDRRSFLKKGLAGGALLALGGGTGLALYPTAHLATPTRALQVLDDRGFQIIVAVARRVVPLEGADHVAVAHGVDEALSYAAPETQKDIGQLLGLFENALAGLVLDGRVQPFTRLDPDAQDRVLEHWRDSKLALRRSGYNALRKLCLSAHYAEPPAWKGTGYRGPRVTGGFALDDSMAGMPESTKGAAL